MVDVAEELAQLGKLSTHDLHIVWRRHHRGDPPESFSRDHLVRAVAYRIQQQAFGGLSPALKRTLMGLVRSDISNGGGVPKHAPVLAPGVRLVRSWRGETHTVLVIPSGFEYRDQRYRSLSQIAKHITGAHWSGPRFFGTVATANVAIDPIQSPRISLSKVVPLHGQA